MINIFIVSSIFCWTLYPVQNNIEFKDKYNMHIQDANTKKTCRVLLIVKKKLVVPVDQD